MTGDGLAAALLLCGALEGPDAPRGRRRHAALPSGARECAGLDSRSLPQSLLAEVDRLNAEFGERGRILVRPSGTEPVVRVLAEAQDFAGSAELCAKIASVVRRELG